MQKISKIMLGIIILCVFLFLSGMFILVGGYVYYYFSDNSNNNNDNNINSQVSWDLPESIEKFNEEDFDNYLLSLAKDYNEENKKQKKDSVLAPLSSSFDMVQETEEKSGYADDESITNVQETGVDEGDIVKAYKDYLVVLRRGRIFVVKILNNDRKNLEAVDEINAYPEGFTKGGWYDEMLIHENNIIVVGYNYNQSATEIGLFEINDNGKIKHENTYFIDSNDYYSSRNYASRLVDNQLIFYMPYYMIDWSYDDKEYRADYTFPKVHKWLEANSVSEGSDILSATDIYKPMQKSFIPTLHTVVTCDLTQEDFNCGAKAVLGPYSRNFYVSANTVYLWVADNGYNYDENEPASYVYAMPLDGQGAGMVRAQGAPLDQFSFKETQDHLNVLLRDEGFGDSMWNPEYSDSDLSFLQIPLYKFSSAPELMTSYYYKSVPQPEGYSLQNRFVGDYLLYGSNSKEENKVYVLNYKENEKIEEIDLESGVSRIEVLDNNNAVVVGNSDSDLIFNWVNLDETSSTVYDVYTVNDAYQGESRSHGFFYSSKLNILGLPIMTKTQDQYWSFFNNSAEIVYLTLDKAENKFKGLGSLKGTSSDVAITSDNCQYSCTDWYGNSRPIFYQDRIFSLMGYEIIEGIVENDEIKETTRINYFD